MNNNNYDDILLEEIKKSASECPVPAALSPDALRLQLRFRQESRRLSYLKRICAAAACIVLVLGGGFLVYQTVGNITGSNGFSSDNNSGSATGELALSTELHGTDSQNQIASANDSQNSTGQSNDSSESGNSSDQDGNAASSASVKNATVGDRFHLASSYEEVYTVLAGTVSSNYLSDGAESWIEEEAVEDADSSSSGLSDATSDSSQESSYSSTNTMVENVDEGDIVKINEEYIYVITEEDYSDYYIEGDSDDYNVDISNHIDIFHIEDGNAELIGTLECCPSNTSTIQEIYLDGERLYVIYSEYYDASAEQNQSGTDSGSDADSDSVCGSETYISYNYSYRTGLITFNVSDAANPEQIGHITQDGQYYTSRKNGDYIYLFSKNYPSSSYCDDTLTEQSLIPQINGNAVSYDSIYLPTIESADSSDSDATSSNSDDAASESPTSYSAMTDCIYIGYSELIISSIYISKDAVDEVTDSLVIVNDDSVYMSENAIYLYSTDYISGVDDDDNSSNDDENNKGNNENGENDSASIAECVTVIAKFTYEDGILNAVNSATVTGSVPDKFALHESDGIFQILTTSYSYEYTYGSNGVLENIDTTPSNQLYLFDAEMQQLGSLGGIAEGEDIYAARYIGDIVYFITYLNTDPLFAVDISDPVNPTLLGQLEITGFSDYLHPYGDGLLLGIGYETDPDTGEELGVKLTMFDVSDPTNLTVLDAVVLEDAEYTPAAYYYKTFLADERENIIGFACESWDEALQKYHTYYCVYEWTDEGFSQVLQTALFNSNGSVSNSYKTRGLYSGGYLHVVTIDEFDVTIRSYDRSEAYQEVDTLVVK